MTIQFVIEHDNDSTGSQRPLVVQTVNLRDPAGGPPISEQAIQPGRSARFTAHSGIGFVISGAPVGHPDWAVLGTAAVEPQ